MKTEIAQGEWYACQTVRQANCWMVKQMGGGFLLNQDEKVALFTRTEARHLAKIMNSEGSL